MTSPRNYLFVCLLLIMSFYGIAQSSYQFVMNDTGLVLDDIMANEDDKIAFLVTEDRPEISSLFYLLRKNESSNIITGWKLEYTSNFIIYPVKKTKYIQSKVCFSHAQTASENSAISCIDIETGNYWSKKMKNTYLHGAVFDSETTGNTLVANVVLDSVDRMELFLFDKDGVALLSNGVCVITSPGDEVYLTPLEIKAGPVGGHYIAGVISGVDGGGSFVLKNDDTGNTIAAKKIEDYVIGKMVVTDDGIYLIDKGYLEYFWSIDFFNSEYTTLIKLDLDLNLVWAKKYYADHFDYSSATINKTNTDELVMSHTTYGAFPVILSRIDTHGNILSQKGYPNFRPKMEVLSDGSLVLGSRHNFEANGEPFIQPVIGKTDQNGDIEGCTTYPTCLRSDNVVIEMDMLKLEIMPIDEPPNLGLLVEPASFPSSPYCNFPPAPTPDFTFPDTLCQGDAGTATNTHNRLANAHEWHLAGPGVDTVNTDSFDFYFSFLNAGEYRLRHTVWVLGCAYEFEKNITVLPEIKVEITPLHLCPNEPQEIIAISDYPNLHYLWSTGDETATTLIKQSGTYSVQADIDGGCLASDTADVFLVADLLGFENPIELPADTVLCDNDLPFLLNIKSNFTDVFYVNNGTVFNGEYILHKSGAYLIETEIEGCRFSKTFNLKTDDCVPQIYFPNIFSPNGDGINDEFYPLGNDFAIITLKIFDRWGGLRYDGAGSAARWSPGSAVAEGAYVYLLVYKNMLTGEVKQASGGVVLVR